jgi:hypothetical protein
MTMFKQISLLAFALATSTFALAGCQSGSGALPEPPPSEPQGEYDGMFCGGIAGFACPDGYSCIDNPEDDCIPGKGGSDCGGICVEDACAIADRQYVSKDPEECAAIRFVCDPGYEAFFDECGCGCEPVARTACGDGSCGPDQFCCNPSCGICAPIGGACIQIVCD